MTNNATELKRLKQALSETKNAMSRAERFEHDLRDHDLILIYAEHERGLVDRIAELEDVRVVNVGLPIETLKTLLALELNTYRSGIPVQAEEQRKLLGDLVASMGGEQGYALRLHIQSCIDSAEKGE